VIRNLHLQCHTGHSGNCFPCLSVCICQHSSHGKSKDLGQPSSSITATTLPLQTEQLKHNSSVAAYQFTNLVDGVRHHCSARLNALQSVVRCCSAYFSLLNLSYKSLNCTHNYTCFTIHFPQTSATAIQLLTFINQKLCNCSLLQPHINFCPFKINSGASIC
jgi:hypothetical protein